MCAFELVVVLRIFQNREWRLRLRRRRVSLGFQNVVRLLAGTLGAWLLPILIWNLGGPLDSDRKNACMCMIKDYRDQVDGDARFSKGLARLGV